MATLVWKANLNTVTGGGWASGTMFRPLTVAFGLWKASSESSRGISIPYTTAWPLYQPSRCSAAPRVVVASPSSAASLTGWAFATSLAAQSPTTTCSGAAAAAADSVMPSAVRSYRPRRPRRNAQADAPAIRNPVTMEPAKYMCTYSLQKNGLANSADHGCTATARPPASRNPVGWFIQALTEMTNIEAVMPASVI